MSEKTNENRDENIPLRGQLLGLEGDIEEFTKQLEELLASGKHLLQRIREQDGDSFVTVVAEIPANGFELEPGDTVLRGKTQTPIGPPG